jgi:DNA-binding protein HU-beta
MNRQEFINGFAKKTNESKKKSGEVLDTFLGVFEETLKKGESIQFIGFGTFNVIKKKERMGINPKTKQKIKIPAKKVIKFKAGKKLADKVR